MTVIKLPKMNVSDNETSFLLEAGEHEMTIKEIRKIAIKSGKNAGKAALNVGLASENNVWGWKQLPIWALPKTAPKNEKDWFRMSTVAFVDALGIKDENLDLDAAVGKTVKTRIGIQNNGDQYGDQNFVVTFIK